MIDHVLDCSHLDFKPLEYSMERGTAAKSTFLRLRLLEISQFWYKFYNQM